MPDTRNDWHFSDYGSATTANQEGLILGRETETDFWESQSRSWKLILTSKSLYLESSFSVSVSKLETVYH